MPHKRVTLALCLGGVLTLLSSLVSATVPASAATMGNPISLVVDEYDGGAGTPYLTFYNDVAKAYMKLHPNVKITTNVTTFTQMESADQLVLSGSNIPSLYEDNQGYLSIFKLAQDKLIVPLGKYATQYGWYKELSAPLLGYDGEVSLSPPVIGTGQVYGLSQSATVVGIYYNTKILTDIHQPVPSTLSAFVHDMALAHQAGYIGLTTGSGGSGTYFVDWLWECIAGAIAPSAKAVTTLRDVINGAPGGSWTTPFVTQAAGMMETWNKDGYLSPNLLSITVPEAESQFVGGKSLFMLDGSFDNPAYQKMGSGVGFFLFPSGSSTHGAVTIATGNGPFLIPARAKNQAAAAAYLNYLAMSQQSSYLYAKTFQLLPIVSVPNEPSLFSGVAKQVASGWTVGSQVSHSIGYIGINTPDSLTLVTSLTEEVIAGRLTPSQFGSKMEADETQYRSTLK